MLKLVVRRCGLLNTLLWFLLALDLAVVALIFGPLRAFSGGDSVEAAARGSTAAPEGPGSPHAAAAADARSQERPDPRAAKQCPPLRSCRMG